MMLKSPAAVPVVSMHLGIAAAANLRLKALSFFSRAGSSESSSDLACKRACSNDELLLPRYKTITMTAPKPRISFVSKCIHDLVATPASKPGVVAEEKAPVMPVYAEGVENPALRCEVRVLHVSILNDELETDIEAYR